MELELGVDILHYLKQFEEEGRDRGSSKVSKIATMFQFSDEGAVQDDRDVPCGLQAKVVRTESHVARFNTARALFEKMSERGGGSEKGVSSKQRRPSGGANKGRGTPSPSRGVELSRSPSPGSNHQLIQPNGHAVHPYKSSSSTTSSIATISSATPNPPSTFPSSISNPSIPVVLPPSSKTFSDITALGNSSWAPTGKNETKNKPRLQEKPKNKSEATYKSEIKLTPDFSTKPLIKNGISKLEASSKDISTPDQISYTGSASKSMVDTGTVDKPMKPSKPETLIDKPLSSHLQNQQIIQRHKNWFQSYSRNKSPSSTPSKSLSPSSSNNPTPEPRSPRDLDKTSSYENLFSKGRKLQQSDDELSPVKGTNKPFVGEIHTHRNTSEDNTSTAHNDWRKERAAILSGRSSRSGGSTDDGIPSPSDPPKGKTFEEAPTLPSCWSPPKQYNVSTTKTHSQCDFRDGASSIDKNPSCRGNRGSHQDETSSYQANRFPNPEEAPSDRGNRVSNTEETHSNQIYRDLNIDEAPSKRGNRFSNPEEAPSRIYRVSRRTLPGAVIEDRRRSMGEVPLRRNNDEIDDREKRLREWERRRSLREFDEPKVHGCGVEDERKRREDERMRREEERKISKMEKKKEEVERKKAEEELARRKKEELERMRLVEEELERKKKEAEREREEERKRRELEEELERLRLEDLRKRREQDEIERRKKEELETRKREEMERRKREEEEIERMKREKEELDRRRREEEMERMKIEEELKKKREEQEIERKKKEDAERKRMEEIERKKREEEERIKREEMEKKRREEIERKRREEEIEKKRKEREELERKRKEEEDIKRRKEEEMERKRIELERRRKEKEELERKNKEEEEERKRKYEEELEKKRIFDELERRKEEEILNRQRAEEQEKRRKEEELRREELEKKWQAKREKLEAEERERRERDRLEIERTKRRISELKRERDEMQRQQAARLRRLMGEEVQGEESQEIIEEKRQETTKERRREINEENRDMYQEKKGESKQIKIDTKERNEDNRPLYQENKQMFGDSRQINKDMKERNEKYEERKQVTEERREKNEETREIHGEKKQIDTEIKDKNETYEEKKTITEENREMCEISRIKKIIIEEQKIEENETIIPMGEEGPDAKEEDKQEAMMLGEERDGELHEIKNRPEELLYDHTVISAQHKLEFCTSPYNGSNSKEESQENSITHEPLFSSSTMSSSFEPLPPPNFEPSPPPIPPHNVDPATLAPKNLDSRLPPLPQEESGSGDPEVMTPEEEKKLLSHKKESQLLSEVEAKEVSEILSDAPEAPEKEQSISGEGAAPENNQGDDIDGFDKDYDSVHVDSPTPDYEDADFVFPGTQVNEEGFVVRVKEVIIEDGVHYFEDGHFWIQVPGILEDDDDDLPETVEVHKHTKIKFSKEPIKLFSTYSVTDYDRKNEDVDPVAASAEYELEKRVEKMHVFPVQIEKGDGGLGLSIIGMGVGADAGVEKLGIFVKTINPGGATDRDGRIRVNDQIIEVDNESLVGVTQVFAASVLKNTSGTVSFLIGRETDPENSEVAMLIKQSLMADQERDDRRRALEGPNFSPHGSYFESFSSQSGADSPSEEGHPTPYPQFKAPEMEEFGGLFPEGKNEFGELYPGQDEFGGRYQVENNEFLGRYPESCDEFGGRFTDHKDEFGEKYPLEKDEFGGPYSGSGPTSPLGGVTSPPPEAFNHEVNAKGLLESNEMIIMSQHLQEVQHRNEMYEEEINILRTKIGEVEKELDDKTDLAAELRETTQKLKVVEDNLQSRQAEIATYQDMLEQSQGQYIILEKKYYKAKKIIKEYQSRERDFLHREEYHITQLEEKDSLYNSLVKALKDRVIQLEGDLVNAQQQAGIPVNVPPDLNSQSSSFLQSSKRDSQSSIQKEPPRKPSTISSMDADLSDNEGAETHTSEGSKSSTVERKVPSKEELDGAVPPTELLDNSFSKAKGELASRGGLANRQLPSLKKSSSTASAASLDKILDDPVDESSADTIPSPTPTPSQHSTSPSTQGPTIITKVVHSSSQHEEISHHSSSSTSTSTTSYRQPPPYHQASSHQHPPPYQPPPSAPLSHRPIVSPDTPHGGRSDSQYRHPPPIARVQPVNRVDLPSVTPTHQQQQQQQSLANQLKALLAEREGNSEPIQRGNRDASPVKKSPTSLMEDVRQAVMQADLSIGKKPVISGPIHVSSTAQVVSTGQFVHNRTSPQKNPGLGASLQQRINRDSGTWSPNLGPGAPPTSPSGGVVLLSQRPIETTNPGGQDEENAVGNRASALGSTDSNSSFDSLPQEKTPGKTPVASVREIVSVFDWTKEQVAQWLVVQGLENHVSTFVSAGITGPRLVNIDTKDLKNLGLSSDDKNKIKRKVKDLRQNLEKERKQIEKENKEREKLQKKAEKLAEKAEKRKK